MKRPSRDALDRLRLGNRRYAAGTPSPPHRSHRRLRTEATRGQSPFATILTCSDSRVSPEIIFDCGSGDLFVIRVAGNIASPTQIGSVEYAVSALDCPLVLVVGHSHCGAVTAALDQVVKASPLSPNLSSIVDVILPAVSDLPPGDDLLDRAVEANVRAAVHDLQTKSAILRGRTNKGSIAVIGAVYSIATGKVAFLD